MASLDEIVVTGSHIPAPSNVASVPLTVLERDDIERGGFDSLGKVLQSLPYNTGSPPNSNVNNGGDGSERIDLRGLGPARTVVLLNGRRFPNGGLGGDASVDLGSIPLSLVDRVEVLTTGATAIYGADAVGGVVNVITRSGFRGFEIGGRQSLAEQGDGQISEAQLLVGSRFGRLNWAMGAQLVNQAGVTTDRRAYSAVPLGVWDATGMVDFAGSFTIPNGLFFIPDGNALALPADFYTRIAGATGQSASDYRLVRLPSDLFNFAPYEFSQTPNDRENVWLLASIPLEHVTLFVEGLTHERTSSQQLAPTPYRSDLDPAPLLSDGTRGIPATNFYNPFGVDLTVLRRFVELPNRGFEEHIKLWRALAGARGRRGSWGWEITAANSEWNTSSTESGAVTGMRLIAALGPSGPDHAGRIVCGPVDPATDLVSDSDIISGCVPVNLFGGAGTLPPEQVNFLNTRLHDLGSGAQRLVELDAEGPWGRLPAGPLRWAIGATYRDERGSYRFDPLRKTGLASADAETDFPGGSFAVRELYAEARAPLLRDHPIARALDLNAGVRYANFSSFGVRGTWQAALRWEPVPRWAVRINYAHVLRAPGLRELYEAPATGVVVNFADPCADNPSPDQRVNCEANGVPGGTYEAAPLTQTKLTIGGNPALAPEQGSSFDVGLDFWPMNAGPVKLSLDFFQIDLSDFIEYPNIDEIVSECIDRGTQDVCALIERAPEGSLAHITRLRQNFGRFVISGYDVTGEMDVETRVGRIGIGVLATHLARSDKQVFPGGAIVRAAGSYAMGARPHWRGLLHAQWERRRLAFGYATSFIGAYTDCGNAILDASPFCRRVSPMLYHDVDAAFRFAHGIKIRGGVNNLTNKDPPFVADNLNANTDASSYRLLGRTYFAEVRYSVDR